VETTEKIAIAQIVITLVAVGAAYWGLRPALTSATAAEQGIAMAREAIEADLERRARQLDVYWGWDLDMDPDDEPHLLMINNRTDDTLLDIAINVRTSYGRDEVRVKRIPPGVWRRRLRRVTQEGKEIFGHVKPVAPDKYSLNDNPAVEVLEYTFKDGTGHRWRSSPFEWCI